jgi:hypothetical protein
MGLPANAHLPSLHLCYERIILTSLTTDQDKIIIYRISQKGLIRIGSYVYLQPLVDKEMYLARYSEIL